jgi:competence protein ComEC
VAASGANIALLAALVLGLAAVLGVPYTARWLVVLALIAVYVPLAGGGPSIRRAGVMGAAAVVAALAGRPVARWYALGLAAGVTLAADPRSAADPGWQMSFAAVAALLWRAPAWRERLVHRRVPAGLAEAIAVTSAATLATAPVLALHLGRVSLVSLPANLLAAPLVAPVMWLGFLAASIGQAVPGLAAPLVAIAGLPLAVLVLIAGLAAEVPGATIAASGLAVLVGSGVLLALVERRALGLRPPWARRGRARRARSMAAALAAAAAVGAVAAAVVGARRLPPPPDHLRVTFLDVGQGDATLLQHGGASMLVDTGPPGGRVVDRLRAAGVRRLDALLVTHAQADHEGGAADVLRDLRVRLLLDGRDGVPSPLGSAMAEAARRAGVRTVRPVAGMVVRAGHLALRILSPQPASAPAVAGADPNERAVVAELRDGPARVLLTADAESDVLAGLDLGEPTEVLKVAHHGSADPGLPALLQRLRPAVAGIEVGAHNTYGHPAPSTLAALRGLPRVVRTDRDGTVRLDRLGSRWLVSTHA